MKHLIIFVGSVVGTVGGAAVGAVCTVGGVAASGTGMTHTGYDS